MTQKIEANVDVTEVSPVVRELRFEIPWETLRSHLDRRYGELRRKARQIKGFRKGKAPRWLLEQMFGPQVHQEVSQTLVTEALTKAMVDHEIAPVATPELDYDGFEQGQPFSFTARIEVRPKLEEVTWEGVELERPIAEVTDAEVDAELEKLRNESAAVRVPEPARPAREGDVLVIDYEVRIEDKAEPERTREDMEIEIGKGLLLDQVEAALVGVEVGDEKVVPIELPEPSGGEEEQRQPLNFHIKVKEIREKILPEVDDEFAKDVSEHETLLELRLALREKLEKQAAAAADGKLKDNLLEALCDANTFEVPPSLVEQQFEETKAEVARMLQIDLDRNPLGEEQTTRMREQGERKVRAALLLTEISQSEELEVSDEDIEQRLGEIAEQTGQPLPKIKAQLGRDDNMEQLRLTMLQQRVVEHILSKANIKDVPLAQAEADEDSGAAEDAEAGGEAVE